jgi:hypothetical protein
VRKSAEGAEIRLWSSSSTDRWRRDHFAGGTFNVCMMRKKHQISSNTLTQRSALDTTREAHVSQCRPFSILQTLLALTEGTA